MWNKPEHDQFAEELFLAGQLVPAGPFGVLRLGPAMLHTLTLLYAASGTAMISTFRIPKP